jgi:phosphoesterase RecJ-like protein
MTSTTQTPPEALVRQIRQANRVLVTAHKSPDGDAIGSELGLARILRQMGKSAVVWNHDVTPVIYEELPGAGRIHVGDEPPAGYPERFDLAVVLECPSPDRTGIEEHLKELPIVNIDHHMGNQHYGKLNWIDTAAPAVGEMIYRLGGALKAALDPQIANCLFLTLVTDTGGFRFSNASAAAFEAAAVLVREGARPEQVSHWVYENRSEEAMMLLREVLGTLQLHAQGRIATVELTQAMFKKTKATPGDTEGLIDYPRSIAGVDLVSMVREVDGGSQKVSLRSRGDADVETIARQHGGGGHRNAAGFTIEGDAETVRNLVVKELSELLS